MGGRRGFRIRFQFHRSFENFREKVAGFGIVFDLVPESLRVGIVGLENFLEENFRIGGRGNAHEIEKEGDEPGSFLFVDCFEKVSVLIQGFIQEGCHQLVHPVGDAEVGQSEELPSGNGPPFLDLKPENVLVSLFLIPGQYP